MTVTHSALTGNHQPNPPGWRLLREEALLRGYKLKSGTANTRAFSKILASIGVEIRGPKKQRVVCPAAIDAAWSRLPLVSASSPSANDDDLVASLVKGRR